MFISSKIWPSTIKGVQTTELRSGEVRAGGGGGQVVERAGERGEVEIEGSAAA